MYYKHTLVRLLLRRNQEQVMSLSSFILSHVSLLPACPSKHLQLSTPLMQTLFYKSLTQTI